VHAAAILKANGLFRAVAIPPGDHEVVMTYAPSSLGGAFLISLAGLGMAATQWVIAGRRRT